MKYLILAAAMTACVPVHAETSFGCSLIGELAQATMEERNDGVTYEEMAGRLADDPENPFIVLGELIALAAYATDDTDPEVFRDDMIAYCEGGFE